MDRSQLTEENLKEIKKAMLEPLSVEIICSAMIALQENPKLTIPQAINIGRIEWDI